MTITIIGTKGKSILEASFKGEYDNIVEQIDLYLKNCISALERKGATPTMFVIWEKYSFGKVEDLTTDYIKQYEHNCN